MSPSPFAAGHLVDDLFFFTHETNGESPVLFLDEVVLFDGASDKGE
jgi:hypothetical protein